MRRRIVADGVTVNAIAGTHVVFLGFDLAKARRPGFRGFGIRRTDPGTGDAGWLRGMKTFEATEPHPAPGENFSSQQHPFQTFQWADYSAKPGRKYHYAIFPMYGSATNLVAHAELKVSVTTEQETGATHSVFFNRGSVASQEYARRFLNRKPSEVGAGARDWLSRGLLEALLSFIGRAQAGWQIRGAVYEFQWPDVLAAIRAAKGRGADVRVLYDDIEQYRTDKKTGKRSPNGPWFKNREAIEEAKIKSVCQGRGNSSNIMHNKFFVLCDHGTPVAVWTGSTNLTENGIFGHSNLGHVVEDEAVARAFLDYWERLEADPAVNVAYRAANTAASPVRPQPWGNGTTAVFSPRGGKKDLDALDWYAEIAAQAQSGLFMTFAFGMHDKFKDVYRAEDDVLRMALLEKAGNNPKTLEQERQELNQIRRRPNVVMAFGNRIPTNGFDRWLEEMDRLNPHVHVQWIHTKYMLVDPLGATPLVVTGSANFSEASTTENDENMLVIRGDRRIADIYLGEYLRLYTHYAFREAVKRAADAAEAGGGAGGSGSEGAAGGSGAAHGGLTEWRPQFLVDDDKWMAPYFSPTDRSGRRGRREYFAGAMVE